MMVAASGEIQKLTNLFFTIVKEYPLTPKTFAIPLQQLQENKATVGSHASLSTDPWPAWIQESRPHWTISSDVAREFALVHLSTKQKQYATRLAEWYIYDILGTMNSIMKCQTVSFLVLFWIQHLTIWRWF